MSAPTLAPEQQPIKPGDQPEAMVMLVDGDTTTPQFITADFGPDDPWSQHAQDTLEVIGGVGTFEGEEFIELGGGDGRNGLWRALPLGARRYTSVELEVWRDDLAAKNAALLGVTSLVTRFRADAVAWIQEQQPGRFDDAWVFACLPQVPISKETESVADGIVAQDSFGEVGNVQVGDMTVDEAGLTLVAASLVALRDKAPPRSGLDALYVLNNRLPDGVVDALWDQTGWQVVASHQTTQPVPQDVDTSLDIYERGDDGKRFYDADGVPMSAAHAEAARERAYESGDTSAPDYPHHHVTVYHIRPR